MTHIKTKFVVDYTIGKAIEIFKEEDTHTIYQEYKKSGIWSSVFIDACGDIILIK